MTDPRDSIDAMLSALLDGSLDDADASRLREAITNDPAVGARYLEFVELHALLHWRSGRGLGERPADTGQLTEPIPAPIPRHPQRAATPTPRRVRSLLVCALALLCAIAVWRMQSGEPGADSRQPQRAPRVGTITRLPGGHLHGDGAWRVDQELVAASELELESGLLEFRLDSGARGLLQGPARLTIHGRDAVTLHHGRLTALLESIGQLQVRTPTALVTDLGTEFGVAVDAATGASSVHVFEGTVRLAGSEPGGDELELHTGESGAVDVDGAIARDIGASYRAFVRSLPIATHNDPREARANPPFAWRDGDGDWHVPASWFANSIPGPSASVRISRNAIVTTGFDAQAGEVFVGNATWVIAGGSTWIDGLQGLLDIGFRRPAARVELTGGTLAVDGRLVLRQGSSILVGDGDLTIGAEIFCVGGSTRIELTAAQRAPVRARALFGLTDSDRIVCSIDEHGARRLELADFAALGGDLELHFRSIPPRRDIVLLEVAGPTLPSGRFATRDGAVVHEFADGARLRLRYPVASSGDGVANDVVLSFEP